MYYNTVTFVLALATLGIYTVYILAVGGLPGLLLSLAAGLITAAFVDHLELIAVAMVVFGFLFVVVQRYMAQPTIITKTVKGEGFENPNNAEGGKGAATESEEDEQKESPSRPSRVPEGFRNAPGSLVPADYALASQMMGSGQEISARVIAMQRGQLGRSQTTGVLSDGAKGYAPATTKNSRATATVKAQKKLTGFLGFGTTEGFEDAAGMKEETNGKGMEAGEGETAQDPAPPAESEPAPKASVTDMNKPVDKEQKKVEAGFQGSAAASGLFKLGEMPSEMKEGPHVDVAATMQNALSALGPDQMAAMTKESQSLLETQKNLMSMLQSMRPVLQDGRQLLDTFSGIFGNLQGVGGLAKAAGGAGGFQLGKM
jgi:hypothetical protein